MLQSENLRLFPVDEVEAEQRNQKAMRPVRVGHPEVNDARQFTPEEETEQSPKDNDLCVTVRPELAPP